jgi:hypothetical protein
MLSRTKACALPYKWPLLADGQDPDALEARLAYHLHRLQLTGAPLREALKGKAFLATALSQARASVDHDFITELATSLNIAADELSRAPTEIESHEWAFYRHSARNSSSTWEKASETWNSYGLSLREASKIIGMSHADVVRATNGRGDKVFDLKHARKLSNALGTSVENRLFPNLPLGKTSTDR